MAPLEPEQDQGASEMREGDEREFSAQGEAPWLPELTVDDRVLLRD
jgi:hypothetical protein